MMEKLIELNIMVNNMMNKYNLGVSQRSLFHDYTDVTSYCLEHYEEVQDIKYCNNIYKKLNDTYKKGNTICINAFQVVLRY